MCFFKLTLLVQSVPLKRPWDKMHGKYASKAYDKQDEWRKESIHWPQAADQAVYSKSRKKKYVSVSECFSFSLGRAHPPTFHA